MPTDKKTKLEDQIDLSKIKNIDAAEAVEPGFSEKVVKPARRKRSGKFDFAAAELIPLPSGGRLYESVTDEKQILKGFIEMYPMTIKEEEILSTPRFIKTGSATRMILERCIASNIDAKDLLLFDSNFLLFYLRKISYGDKYKFEITCSNPICERKFTHEVDISKLVFEDLPKTVKEPITIKLPVSKFTVKTILPRLYHSEEIFMRNQNRKKSSTDEDKRMLDNLIVTTLEVLDKSGEEVRKSDWEEFYESLTGIDSGTLREKTTFSTGVDELKGVICPYCDADYSGTIPIGPEFFRF